MPISLDGRLIWTSTNASIPTDWSEDTDFTDKYMQGDDETFTESANGGSALVGHTSDAHTHNGNSHNHALSGGSATPRSRNVNVPGPPVVIPTSGVTHTHASATSPSTTITYQNVTPSILSKAIHPSGVKIIIIKPDDANQDIPDDAVCFTNDTTLPTGFEKTDGGGSRPALNGKFLKGVDNDGDDSFLGVFGADTHTHNQSGLGHNHVQNHTHSDFTSGNASPSVSAAGTTGQDVLRLDHHTLRLSVRSTTTSTDTTITSAGSSLPEFIKVLGIQNTSAGATTPDGVIIPYVGSVASVPDGWVFCDGDGAGVPDLRDRQIRVTTVDGEILGTGGSATHTHTIDHGHTESTHGHSVTDPETNQINRTAGVTAVAQADLLGQGHSHAWSGIDPTPTLDDTVATMSSDEARYLYRTVIFIKKMVRETTVHIKGSTHIKGETVIL